MLVEMGSFDVIIGMDWLLKYSAVIDCAKKIVRILSGSEILIVHGDGCSEGHRTRLNVISCTKVQKYPLKGSHLFLAHVTTKEIEDKSEKKRLEDVPIVKDFHDVFPEVLPVSGLPQTRTVDFHIESEYLNKQEHEEHLKIILELLKKEEFKGIHVDPAKIESFKDWTSPKSPTEIRQFLGLAGAPILALPEGSEDFIAYCDASKKGLGAWCSLSRSGDIIYMELSVRCSPIHQEFATHFRSKELNLRATRWLELLSDYDCDIRYHPGKANVVADALSRKEREPPTGNQKNIKSEDVGGVALPCYGDLRTVIMHESTNQSILIHPWFRENVSRRKEAIFGGPYEIRHLPTIVCKCLTCAKVKAKTSKTMGLWVQPNDTNG
ncbi:putative reverse transcriptase domain-containing protein [Tanacetum coccineum]